MNFDEWLKRPLASFKDDHIALDALSAKLEERCDNARVFLGRLECKCCVCEKWTESPVSIEELEPIESYEHYCGGSPRCCP